MKNVLLISGHTDIKNSFANKNIIENIKKEIKNIEISSLCELYPNYIIDVEKEQAKLKNADIIIVQFPMFWYNAPSIIRKYFEDVLLHGFAYGSKGKALEGKKFIVSFTTGSPEEAYKHGGAQNFELGEFMPSFQQLSNLCSMQWCGFISSSGYTFTTKEDYKKELVISHSKKIIDKINSL